MILDNLLGLSLERVEPDAASIKRLLEAARCSLGDAQLPNMSSEGHFDMTYKAIMQAANAALQATDFVHSPANPGIIKPYHQTMIQTLPRTIELDASTMVLLDQMRKQRNVIDYTGDLVSETLAADATCLPRLRISLGRA